MRQLLCFKSRFPNHFAFTLWTSLILVIFGQVYFDVDDESLHTLDN
jgi:hypothetical protein